MTGNNAVGETNRKIPLSNLILSFLVLLMLFFASIITGPVEIPIPVTFKMIFDPEAGEAVWRSVIFSFRIPKAFTAVLAGLALSVSGLQMQTVFRNPLAGPDVLGISSGASLGVALIVLGMGKFFVSDNTNYLNEWVQIMAASAGAAFVLILVMAVSMRVRDIMTILILGILFGSAVSALVSILQYFSNQALLKAFVIWTMGSLGNLGTAQLKVLLAGVITGLIITFISIKRLNVLLTGETYARSMGVNVKTTRILIFLSTSILTGAVTAFCGPIGFIGIAIPHLARIFYKTSDHRVLIPGCIILGASLMLLSDILTQLPGDDLQLPINAVTALIGIPVVIWVIVRNKKLVQVN